MAAGEFIDRFMQHILPKEFKRIRHYGLIGRRAKRSSWLLRAALEAPMPQLSTVETFMRRVIQLEWMNCPHCREGRFVVVEVIPPASKQRCPPRRGPP
ncbi:Putative transposase [Nitrosomonas sp. Nm33]|nr:Putative transposase [Nitrosomonas sp. Nm33]